MEHKSSHRIFAQATLLNPPYHEPNINAYPGSKRVITRDWWSLSDSYSILKLPLQPLTRDSSALREFRSRLTLFQKSDSIEKKSILNTTVVGRNRFTPTAFLVNKTWSAMDSLNAENSILIEDKDEKKNMLFELQSIWTDYPTKKRERSWQLRTKKTFLKRIITLLAQRRATYTFSLARYRVFLPFYPFFLHISLHLPKFPSNKSP